MLINLQYVREIIANKKNTDVKANHKLDMDMLDHIMQSRNREASKMNDNEVFVEAELILCAIYSFSF